MHAFQVHEFVRQRLEPVDRVAKGGSRPDLSFFVTVDTIIEPGQESTRPYVKIHSKKTRTELGCLPLSMRPAVQPTNRLWGGEENQLIWPTDRTPV